MESNALVFSWDRAIPNRGRMSADHFDEFVQFLMTCQGAGELTSFECVFLDPQARNNDGFYLIRGSGEQLNGAAGKG